MITAVTGPLSAERSHDVAAVRALIDSINASGGVSGHPLTLVVQDDASSATGAVTAAELLVADHVVGVDFDDATIDGGAAKYLNSQKMPTTGLGDSASWVNYNNLFGIYGYSDPSLPATTTYGVLEKGLGVTKVAGVAYGTIPPSVEGVQATLKAAAGEGVQTVGSVNMQLGGNNYTSLALQLKDTGAQGFYTGTATNDNVGLGTAITQEGMHLPGMIFSTGYELSTLQSASTLQGTYWLINTAPFTSNNPAAVQYRQTLAKYAPGVFGGSQETFAYVGAELLVAGLQADQGSSSPSALLTSLGSLSSFNAGGLLAAPIDYTKPKATQISGLCTYVVSIKGSQFVQYGSGPVCGQLATS
jgi:branched-chain amino acid transport system substrate-binding protein